MAQMLEDLQLEPGQRVLEIGAGTGYNAALLAHVVGPIVSIDVDHEVLASAHQHLLALPDREVELYHADGRLGFPVQAPYDRIQATAATPDLEPAWLEQTAPGGWVQAPLDLAPGLAFVVQGEVQNGVFTGGLTRPAYFMPLREEGEAGRDRNTPDSPLPGPERMHATPAPWSGWNDRRPGVEPGDFLPSLALLGWLQGLTLGYATCPDGRPGHGVVDLVHGQACWLGPYDWRISGKGGHEMGLRLWQRLAGPGRPAAPRSGGCGRPWPASRWRRARRPGRPTGARGRGVRKCGSCSNRDGGQGSEGEKERCSRDGESKTLRRGCIDWPARANRKTFSGSESFRQEQEGVQGQIAPQFASDLVDCAETCRPFPTFLIVLRERDCFPQRTALDGSFEENGNGQVGASLRRSKGRGRPVRRFR